MSTIPAKTAFAVLGFAVILFLSCSDYERQVFPGVETFPPLSSETEVSSSSSGEVDGLSSSSGEVDGLSSSSEDVSSSSCDDTDKCGGECYDKRTYFCINGTTKYKRCDDGNAYNPMYQICCGSTKYSKETYACCGTIGYEKEFFGCREEVLLKRCGTTNPENLYNEEEQFCASGDVLRLCNGRMYFTDKEQYCEDGVVKGRCGDNMDFDFTNNFCYNGTSHDLCGSKDYNPDNQFCFTSTIYDNCGNNESYNPLISYCYNKKLYSCNDKPYNPSTHICCNEEIFPLKREHYGKMKEQFCDERDGTRYVKVDIDNQTWMAENLNFKTEDGNSRCYPINGNTNSSDDDNTNCGIYGRLYNLTTAKDACPDDWHLPSNNEWDILVTTAGTDAKTKLKVNGTDDYGFSALPGGKGSASTFDNIGTNGYWWSSTISTTSKAYYRTSGSFNSNIDNQSSRFSVRCVKDNL